MAIITRTLPIANGETTDKIIDSITVTGSTAYTVTPLVYPYTLGGGLEVLVTVSYDDTGLGGGKHTAIVTVTADSGTYVKTTTISSVIGVQPTPILLRHVYVSTDISTPIDISISATNATAYSVPNLPAFASLNPTTGVVTITPDGTVDGMEKYDVVLSNIDGSLTITDGLQISLFKDNAGFQTELDTTQLQASTTLANAGATIVHTTPKVIGESGGLNSFFNVYYTGYGQNTQVLVTDSSSITQYDDTTIFASDNFHLTPHIYVGNGVTYLPHYSTGGQIRFSKFDTTTNTMTSDIIPLDPEHQNSQSSMYVAQGLDGRCYSFASQDGTGTLASIIALDLTTGVSEKWNNLSIPDGVSRVAADLTHVYYNTNRYGDGQIYSLRLTDGLVANLTGAETAKFDIQQRKNGVVVRVIGTVITWRHLYNGAMSADIADLNATPPWGVDATDLYNASYVTDINAQPTVSTTAMRPINGGTVGKLWYKYNEVDPYVSVNITGILTHPTPLNRVSVLGNGNVLYTHAGYNGLTEFNPTDNSVTHRYLAEGTLSPYAMATKGNKTIITGYFGSPLFELDPTQLWDNEISATFDPNVAQVYTNPLYRGNVGSALNVSKAYSCCIDKYGNSWMTGEKIRSGEGGGVIYDNGTTTLAVASLITHEGRSIDSNDDYVVVVSLVDTGSATISVIDIDTKTVTRQIVPDVGITTNAGRLVLDDEHVYLLTNNDLNTTTNMYKFLLSDGSLVKSNIFPFLTSIGGDNDAEGGDFKLGLDGYLYAIFKTVSNPTLVRIDPTSLYAKAIKTYPSSDGIGRFDLVGNKLYSFADSSIREADSYQITRGYRSLIDPNLPTLSLDATLNQYIEFGTPMTSAESIANGYTYFYTVQAPDVSTYYTALQLSQIAVYTGYQLGIIFNNNVVGTARDTAPIANVLYRCAITYDPATWTTTLYVNGVATASQVHTTTPFTTGTKWAATIGAKNDSTTRSLQYTGLIGQIQAWNAIFTPAQVLYDYENRGTALYISGTPATDNPLVNIADCRAWLPLNEGTGIVVNELINGVTFPIINNGVNNWA